jgi:hypothetical protein
VLRPEDQDLAVSASVTLQAAVSEAISAPYSLFAGPATAHPPRRHSSLAARLSFDTDTSFCGKIAGFPLGLPVKGVGGEAAASAAETSPVGPASGLPRRRRGVATAGSTDGGGSFQEAASAPPTRSASAPLGAAVAAAVGAAGPLVLRKSAFGGTLPSGRSVASAKSRPGRVVSPGGSRGVSSLRSAGAQSVGFNIRSAADFPSGDGVRSSLPTGNALGLAALPGHGLGPKFTALS